MDELKRWLLNRIGVAEDQARQSRSDSPRNWQERSCAYEAVLDKINQIERVAAFDEWYDPCLLERGSTKMCCREAWNAALKAKKCHAEKAS